MLNLQFSFFNSQFSIPDLQRIGESYSYKSSS